MFIKKIKLDNNIYLESQIIDHVKKETSINLLEQNVFDFIKEELGREAFEQAKINDVDNLNNIPEPAIDGITLFRIINHPNQIHVYQKKTITTRINNWTWGTSNIFNTQFKRIYIFELEYTNLTIKNKSSSQKHMIHPDIKNQRPTRENPIFNVIQELKNSTKFRQMSDIIDGVL